MIEYFLAELNRFLIKIQNNRSYVKKKEITKNIKMFVLLILNTRKINEWNKNWCLTSISTIS